MTTIELNGVTLTLTEETAKALMAELEEEREARKRHWMMWHWHARRWAMYGDRYDDGSIFSDLYKDETGIRPRFSRDDVMWILYERDCWIEHGPHCVEYRKAKKQGWGLY